MSLSYPRCSIPLYTKEFQVRVCGHDNRDIKSLLYNKPWRCCGVIRDAQFLYIFQVRVYGHDNRDINSFCTERCRCCRVIRDARFLYVQRNSKFAYMVMTIATLNPFCTDAAESFAMLDSFMYKVARILT